MAQPRQARAWAHVQLCEPTNSACVSLVSDCQVNVHDRRPLLIFGKGAAYARADAALVSFVEASGVPFLGSAMGRGCVPDSHPACVAAARSLALAQADVAVIVGAR